MTTDDLSKPDGDIVKFVPRFLGDADKITERGQRYCRDCKWARVSWSLYILGGLNYSFADCAHPVIYEKQGDPYYPVSGKRRAGHATCVSMRQYDCGKEGKYWEHK